MLQEYLPQPYSPSALGQLFDKYSHEGEGQFKNKSHLKYLDKYLSHVDIGAKTILVETPYTDKDYIEDYATYYARCHTSYIKACARLHFFNFSFDSSLIDKCLDRDTDTIDLMKKGYLGFIVVKPLPSTIIGRTCLKTYSNSERNRFYPCAIKYTAHFLGLDFCVESVPFQEQDTDVAACATSAVWSVLNLTGKIFHHHIPTPAKITEAAGIHQRPGGRVLPAANGLNAHQMADAMRSVGLEPIILKTKNLSLLRISAYAYMRAHIPNVLLGSIGSLREDESFDDIGGHAISIVGYSLPEVDPRPFDPTGCLFTATGISRLYAHDDQVGPFARLKFLDESNYIGTSYYSEKEIIFAPDMIIVPLYHKIRVPVDAVIKVVCALDEWLEAARLNKILPTEQRIIWDLYLNEVNDFKRDIFSDDNLSDVTRKDILKTHLPRYIWRAEATCAGKKIFELLFDATDLLQGSFFVKGLPFDADLCKAVGIFMKNPTVQGYLKASGPAGAIKASAWFENYSNE